MTDEKVYFGFYTEQPSSLSAMYCYSNKSVLYGSLSAFLSWSGKMRNLLFLEQFLTDAVLFWIDLK